MTNFFSQLLDRLNATQRTRQILVNAGLFITVLVTFILGNPTFELSPESVKWIMVLAFLGNALAAVITVPYRMVPLGYDLVEDNGIYALVKTESSSWVGLILDALKATDQLKTILANLGIFIGLVLTLLFTEGILPEEAPRWIAGIGFIGNALAGILNNPNRTIPEAYDLVQMEDGSFIIRLKEPDTPVGDPVGPVDDSDLIARKAAPMFRVRPGTVFQF